jgi:cytochrome c oxidase cbb3-type subunit IV
MVSGIITAILLLLFLIGSAWAFSPRRKSDFDAASQLPFGGDTPDGAATHGAPTLDTNEEETRP